MIAYATPDLRVHPPRSPRCRLGGYVHLPRILDKARAAAAGRLGQYDWPAPLDRYFYEFTGLTPELLLEFVRDGAGDAEVLARLGARVARSPMEIAAWSAWLTAHAPKDAEMHAWVAEEIVRLAPGREDVVTFFDLLELDDYVSFGGRG